MLSSFGAQVERETDRTPLIVRTGLADPVNNPLAAAASTRMGGYEPSLRRSAIPWTAACNA